MRNPVALSLVESRTEVTIAGSELTVEFMDNSLRSVYDCFCKCLQEQ